MAEGIFRGTCEGYFSSELIFFPGTEIYYSPSGDFTGDLITAVRRSYLKAIETKSIPIVACLKDRKFIGRRVIPLSEIIFIGIGNGQGLDQLVQFYNEHINDIPEHERDHDISAILHELGLKKYLDQN